MSFPGIMPIVMPAAVLAGVSIGESMILPGLLKMVGYSDSDMGAVAQQHADHPLGGAIYVFSIGALATLVNSYANIY